jgi:hypothetical protein
MRSTLDPIIRGDDGRAATILAAAAVLFVAALDHWMPDPARSTLLTVYAGQALRQDRSRSYGSVRRA